MFTSEQIQNFIRIVIYWLAGFAVHKGWTTDSTGLMIAGELVAAANFAWTLYGNRLLAKINELAKQGEVETIVVKTPEMGKAAPSDKVISK